MRKFGILGALLAVAALSAVAAVGASANVWLTGGSLLKETKAANTHGELTFNNNFLGNIVKILCSGLFIGTVGPETKDLVTEVVNLAGTEKNLVLCTSHNTTLCGGKVLLHPENLPWNTLLLPTSPIKDDFLADGKGEPSWLLLCETGFFKEVLCKKEGSANFTGNGPNGAKFEYTEAGTETTCSNGAKGWIEGTGEVLGFTVA